MRNHGITACCSRTLLSCYFFLLSGFWGGYFYSLAFFHVSSIVALLFCGFASVFPLRETNDQVGGKKTMSKYPVPAVSGLTRNGTLQTNYGFRQLCLNITVAIWSLEKKRIAGFQSISAWDQAASTCIKTQKDCCISVHEGYSTKHEFYSTKL